MAGNSDSIAAAMDGRRRLALELTYGELADAALRLAGSLRDLGVATGDRVVMMIRNVWQFHAADLAVMMCGATPVSIYNSSSIEAGRLSGRPL